MNKTDSEISQHVRHSQKDHSISDRLKKTHSASELSVILTRIKRRVFHLLPERDFVSVFVSLEQYP